jgi:AraC family transcriptional regulator
MEYRIETRPAFSLTGVSLRTTTKDKEEQSFKEVPALWARCAQDGTLAALEALIPPGSTIGIAGVCAEFDMANGDFSYFIAIETPADCAALPPGCRDIAVPAATWGVFESRGPIPEAIQAVTLRIFGEWFPSSGWEHAEGPELEIYPPGNNRNPDYYSEVWVPLQKPGR